LEGWGPARPGRRRGKEEIEQGNKDKHGEEKDEDEASLISAKDALEYKLYLRAPHLRKKSGFSAPRTENDKELPT
jgi:hypothetical protein